MQKVGILSTNFGGMIDSNIDGYWIREMEKTFAVLRYTDKE